MKVLSFSYCFPHAENTSWGIFVYQRLAAMAKRTELKVCSPVPWFPLLTAAAGHDNEQRWNDLSVFRPRFFYTPKLFKNYDGKFYASGLQSWFDSLRQTWQPDILDAHFVWPDGVGVALLAQKFNIPYMITLRGKLYECLKNDNQTQQCAAALQGAAAVISVSTRMAVEAAKMGVAEQRLHVITNGVNLDLFYPRDKVNCREQLGLPIDAKLLVTVAHLGPRKGHHEMIQALLGLPEEVKLVIVGGAAQGGTVDGLMAIAKAHAVEDRLILTGPQPYELIPLYFSAADASVLASYREGCPNAVLESLASGTPVIASDVGAVPDILPVPATGRMVPAEQIDPLRVAVADVLSQSWNASDVVRDSGVRSWGQVAEEVQSVLESVIST